MGVSDLMVSSDSADSTSPADPIAEKIDAIAMLHARAESMVERHQHNVEAVTEWIGRPRTLFAVVLAVTLWIVLNSAGIRFGLAVVDPPPFYWLQGAIGLSALLLTIVVLITQNRMGKLAVQREQLDLQISLMVEHRTAKIIQLLEELRRDIPIVRDRVDEEAEVLQKSADPEQILTALEHKLSESQDQTVELTNHTGSP
jgi:uncharacterized membrane protein